MYNIIAICGKSGAGKDSILNAILSTNHNEYINPIISYTSRPIRDNETGNKDYYFVSKEDFIKLVNNNKMLEHTSFNGWYYGTGIDGLSEDKINIGVFNPDGILTLLQDNRVNLYIFYIDASDKTRLIRQLTREKDPDVREIVRRYHTDDIDFNKLSRIPLTKMETLNNEDRFDFVKAICRIQDVMRAAAGKS